jgi:uncharacterized protein YdiU (UPF0061 family)
MKLQNTYATLGPAFYQLTSPEWVENPTLFLWNNELAEELGITPENGFTPEKLAEFFSGNAALPGSTPLAMAYAGHQFGNFVPQLGDGRAHIIGDLLDFNGTRRELQLKGSGQTAFSRNGDGRYAMGPAIREFIMSEAMYALGVPTTRTLSVVATDETVFRQQPERGAVLTRVASSHIRVGTFEYFAARSNNTALEQLADHVIERHYPDIAGTGTDRFLNMLEQVMNRQIELIVEWLRVGFIHGVMNTDNTALSGETIDFGPCAMVGIYDPQTVYSSIDRQGRYAFGNQPTIAQWNMARLAETLIPLIDTDESTAIEKVSEVVHRFADRFLQQFHRMMANKLGLENSGEEERKLIGQLLETMQQNRLDYTLTFNWLSRAASSDMAREKLRKDLGDWADGWLLKLQQQKRSLSDSQKIMQRHNPLVIPRNHHVEKVLTSCLESGLPDAAEQFLEVLRKPYELTEKTALYQDTPADGDAGYKTFCGT